jgi:hypothetical protein
MPFRGSSDFEAYARTLRRVFWSEFLDRQMGLAPLNHNNPAAAPQAEPAIAVYPLPAKHTGSQR